MSNTITLPQGATITFPFPFPGFPQPSGTPAGLPNLPIPTLPTLPQGGDLSSIITALLPLLAGAIPQLAPFLPIIGVLLKVLHALSTQVNNAAASGTPNESLQMVHDAAWKEVLSLFAPQHPAATPPAT